MRGKKNIYGLTFIIAQNKNFIVAQNNIYNTYQLFMDFMLSLLKLLWV